MNRRLVAIAAIVSVALLVSTAFLRAQQGAKRSIWDGVYTQAQADRGKELFSQNCAKCHGDQLEGMDEIPPLQGENFMTDWETQSIADLVARIHNTMPMDNPGALNVAKATDVAAYLLSANNMPVGSLDLPYDISMQSQIRIDLSKPGN